MSLVIRKGDNDRWSKARRRPLSIFASQLTCALMESFRLAGCAVAYATVFLKEILSPAFDVITNYASGLAISLEAPNATPKDE